MDYEFKAFSKIPRLNREVIVTEKIDGTNGLVFVSDDLDIVKAGSRSRWLTEDHDNYGFYKFVEANRDELRRLGPGYHYGEWWGSGIQRRYGMNEKRFSLFNATRWADPTVRPACCHVVPEIARGADFSVAVELALNILRAEGSRAAPGFMHPEGIVVFHADAGRMFKVLLENDDVPKGKAA